MTCCSTTADAIMTTERTTRIRISQPASAGQCSANSVAGVAASSRSISQPTDQYIAASTAPASPPVMSSRMNGPFACLAK